MPMTDAQRRAREKWLEKVTDVKFRVTKEKKEIIQAHAQKNGESVNAFLNRAVDEAITRETTEQGK